MNPKEIPGIPGILKSGADTFEKSLLDLESSELRCKQEFFEHYTQELINSRGAYCIVNCASDSELTSDRQILSLSVKVLALSTLSEVLAMPYGLDPNLEFPGSLSLSRHFPRRAAFQ